MGMKVWLCKQACLLPVLLSCPSIFVRMHVCVCTCAFSVCVCVCVCVCAWQKCKAVWLFHHLCPPCPQISASHPDTQIKHSSSFSAVFCVGRVKRFLKWPYPVSPPGRGGKLSLPLSIYNFLFLSVNSSPFPCLAFFFFFFLKMRRVLKLEKEKKLSLWHIKLSAFRKLLHWGTERPRGNTALSSVLSIPTLEWNAHISLFIQHRTGILFA